MIGWVQNVLVELLEEVGGAELRDRVFALAGVPEGTRYRMDRNYSDEEVHRLLAATAEATGMDADAMNEAYGRAFLAKSKRMFPKFFDDIHSSRDLLHRQAAIHRSLGAGLRDAAERETVAKKFVVNEDGYDLVVDYQSKNGMCGLYRKMANIIADEHGERIVVTSERCAKRDGGPAQCRFRLHWPDANRG
jgi:hypothetical protein